MLIEAPQNLLRILKLAFDKKSDGLGGKSENKPASQAASRPFPMKLHQWAKSTHSANSP